MFLPQIAGSIGVLMSDWVKKIAGWSRICCCHLVCQACCPSCFALGVVLSAGVALSSKFISFYVFFVRPLLAAAAVLTRKQFYRRKSLCCTLSVLLLMSCTVEHSVFAEGWHVQRQTCIQMERVQQ